MRKLKVYGGTYDGINRLIVAATTKKAAYEAMKASTRFIGCYKSWDDYTSDSGNDTDIAVATASPLTVFSRDTRDRSAAFTPIHKDGERK